MQQGKSETDVRKEFDRKYGGKLKGKEDETWEKFLKDYYGKYPKQKTNQVKQLLVETSEKNVIESHGMAIKNTVDTDVQNKPKPSAAGTSSTVTLWEEMANNDYEKLYPAPEWYQRLDAKTQHRIYDKFDQ